MNQYEMKKMAYQSNLKNRALQVLLYLIDRSNKEGTCFPAIATIGRELHISVSTVKRAMGELVEAGYVVKKTRFRESNGGQTSNLYRLDFSENQNIPKSNKDDKVDQRKDTAEKKSEATCERVYNHDVENRSTNYKNVVGKRNSNVHFIGLKHMWTGEEINLIPP